MSRKNKIKIFLTSRVVCPYNCTYCFNHALFELYGSKAKRFASVAWTTIIEEINGVRARYPLEFVVFVDDTFVVCATWLEEFAEKFPQEVGLPFFCNSGPIWSHANRSIC